MSGRITPGFPRREQGESKSAIDAIGHRVGLLATSADFNGVVSEPKLPKIGVGCNNLQEFEFTQRVARLLSSSTMVPETYRAMVPNKRRRGEFLENHNAIPNCVIALNMAEKLGIDVLTVMQSLIVIEGRPSWKSEFLIASINSSGKFGRLKYRLENCGAKEAHYEYTEWVNDNRVQRKVTVPIEDVSCTAFGTDPDSGEEIKGPKVSIEMAVKEGWYTRNGSKWQTMSDIMLRYRAAAFFARTNAPELTMGMRTFEEEGDIIEAEAGVDDVWTTSKPTSKAGVSDVPENTQQQEEASVESTATVETFNEAALDENGDAIADADGVLLNFSVPIDFARWFVAYRERSPNPQAVTESNADALEAANRDPEAAAILAAGLPNQAADESEAQDQEEQQPVAEPIPLTMLMNGRTVDWATYRKLVSAALEPLTTEEEVNAWEQLNEPIYHGRSQAVQIDHLVKAKRGNISAPGGQVDHSKNDTDNLIARIEATKDRAEYDEVVGSTLAKAVISRIGRERPDDLKPQLKAAAERAIARFNAAIAAATVQPPRSDEEPPLRESEHD